jgi:uncharacterized protein (DUF1800 family)
MALAIDCSRPEAGGERACGPEPDRVLSRRGLLTHRAGWAAFWGGLAAVRGVAEAAGPPAFASADVDPGSMLIRLVDRATMGRDAEQLSLAEQLGFTGYLDRQLNHLAIDDSALDARLAAYTTLTMNPQQLYPLPASQAIGELSAAAILRAVLSKRQLFERMVEFWTDHFNIDINNGDDRWLKTVDDREVVRRHALGTFPDLVNASARSPAMLLYLDNNTSISGNPNENYSRELLELHTMGVDGGYTQRDVEEVARCFTGWGLFGRSSGASSGLFRYNAGQHDNGQKTVLGNIIPAGGGINDGVLVLNILIDHPSTASFVSKKLARWLLGENVGQAAIDAVRSAYVSTRGDVKAMIRAALQPSVLLDAQPRFKRPFHHFVSALRVLPTTIAGNGPQSLRGALNGVGHHPFYWGPPDGYPDSFEYWSGGLLSRWNFGASLGAGSLSGVTLDAGAFFSGLGTALAMAERINTAMFAGRMPAAEQARIREYLTPSPLSLTTQREALGLAVGSPAFLWY